MAVMDAAIFKTLWRHTAQLNMQKKKYKGFSRIILLPIFIDI